ncbi:MAG: GDP-mannose pyrophosphatase NudK [Ginsengibacter sp.]
MNDPIKIIKTEILSHKWSELKEVTFKYQQKDGNWQTQKREIYGRGNAAAILLYNKNKRSVILTRQFRLASFLNGNRSGMLIEACAGLLDDDNPYDAIKRETEEETGYRIHHVTKIFESYMSPGSLTEILYFFIAEYTHDMKVSEGGGVAHEQENIEVLELDFDDAFKMIESGEIKDAKTILLLQYIRLNNIL